MKTKKPMPLRVVDNADFYELLNTCPGIPERMNDERQNYYYHLRYRLGYDLVFRGHYNRKIARAVAVAVHGWSNYLRKKRAVLPTVGTEEEEETLSYG